MKTFKKIQLKKAIMSDSEMKNVLGRAGDYKTCATKSDKKGCTDDTKGKNCKFGLIGYAGTCAFINYYNPNGEGNYCFCYYSAF